MTDATDRAPSASRQPDDRQFIEEYAGLVRSIALKVKHGFQLNGPLDDLIADGNEGLWEARQRFDPTRGVQFRTFAYYRIRGAMLDGVRRLSYLSRRAHAKVRAAEAADRLLETAGEARAVAPDEPRDAVASSIVLEKALQRLSSAYVLSSLGQGPEEHADTPEEQLSKQQQKAHLQGLLEHLEERERRLIEGFYLEGRRFDEVAAELGISKSWASRLHTKALDRLRQALGGER